MNFEPLDPKRHDRKGFDCGVEDLNAYLQRFASQDAKKSLSRTYVLAEGRQILGFYSLSAHAVSRQDLPDGFKRTAYKELPFVLLGRLAIDVTQQRQGLGGALLVQAMKQTTEAAEGIGILEMLVEAKDEGAAAFYKRFGFLRLRGTPHRLAMPLTPLKAILSQL